MTTVAVCIYGKGGTGKTTLLGTMPGKGMVIDVPTIEGGTMVLADKADSIDVFEANDWRDLGDVYTYLLNEKHVYDWVAVDTITAAQDLAKRKTLRERELGADPSLISLQDYGKIGQLNSELYYFLKKLPIHVVLLAQERTRGGDEGAREYQPDVSPASLSALIPPMTLVGRLYCRELEDPRTQKLVVERRLRVGVNLTTYAKVRAVPGRSMPPVISEPHLGRLIAYLLGKDVSAPEAPTDADQSSGMSIDLAEEE